MKIFITGGGGMIGKAVAKEHLAVGDDVAIWCNRSNKWNDYSKHYGTDLSDRVLERALEEFQPDIISHHAAFVGVADSMAHPKDYYDNNIGITAELIQAITDRVCRPSMVIHAGSMGPYGEVNDGHLSRELDALRPVSHYAASKMFQEEMLRVMAISGGPRVRSLRYFSVYSTSGSPLNPKTGVLSIIANKILNAPTIELNEDGTQTRDLVNAVDCARAHVATSRWADEATFVPFNVGTGRAVTLRYVAEKMKLFCSSTKEIVFNGKKRAGDVRHACADTRRIRETLGWIPIWELDQDIEMYCRFVMAHKDEFTTEDTCAVADAELKEKGLLC